MGQTPTSFCKRVHKCLQNKPLQTQGLIKRREGDSNPREDYSSTRIPIVRLQPLSHLSKICGLSLGPEPRSDG